MGLESYKVASFLFSTMNRITSYGLNPAICKALDTIPQGIISRLHFDWLIGCDPVYIGLHNDTDIGDGRSYRNTGHVAYRHNQINRGKTTIVIPDPDGFWPPYLIVHEIAHVLDEYLGWEHKAIPVTEYGKTNNLEAFAEAFTAWLFYGYATIKLPTQSEIDPVTEALFESLK